MRLLDQVGETAAERRRFNVRCEAHAFQGIVIEPVAARREQRLTWCTQIARTPDPTLWAYLWG